MSLSSCCSVNKHGDTSSVPWPRHAHPGLSLSQWPALVSAAAAVLAGVKGRFYYSHEGLMRLFSAAVRCRLARGREEGICPQPAGRDSRLTSLPAAVAQASKEVASLAGGSSLPTAARGRCCSARLRFPGARCPELWDRGGGNKQSYHHPLPLRPLLHHLPPPLRLLRCQPPALRFPRSPWQDKTSLKKNALGKEKVEETFNASVCSHLSCRKQSTSPPEPWAHILLSARVH